MNQLTGTGIYVNEDRMIIAFFDKKKAVAAWDKEEKTFTFDEKTEFKFAEVEAIVKYIRKATS